MAHYISNMSSYSRVCENRKRQLEMRYGCQCHMNPNLEIDGYQLDFCDGDGIIESCESLVADLRKQCARNDRLLRLCARQRARIESLTDEIEYPKRNAVRRAEFNRRKAAVSRASRGQPVEPNACVGGFGCDNDWNFGIGSTAPSAAFGGHAHVQQQVQPDQLKQLKQPKQTAQQWQYWTKGGFTAPGKSFSDAPLKQPVNVVQHQSKSSSDNEQIANMFGFCPKQTDEIDQPASRPIKVYFGK